MSSENQSRQPDPEGEINPLALADMRAIDQQADAEMSVGNAPSANGPTSIKDIMEGGQGFRPIPPNEIMNMSYRSGMADSPRPDLGGVGFGEVMRDADSRQESTIGGLTMAQLSEMSEAIAPVVQDAGDLREDLSHGPVARAEAHARSVAPRAWIEHMDQQMYDAGAVEPPRDDTPGPN